ncbi:uncharacterized protein LOC114426621 [Parambassis ranga]|uniref:Uncharacterized protein LOC114426621 n=1 Tax=Parambassis ranga TaxID=210632 RepID=A0A6P7H4C8_9TELE|nr:uncharacterized protein LOC114426621 [Parambassis ranga]
MKTGAQFLPLTRSLTKSGSQKNRLLMKNERESFTQLTKLINKSSSTKNSLKLIKWLQKRRLLKRKMKCRLCRQDMKLKKRTNCGDQYAWICRQAHKAKQVSVRHKSIFHGSKLSFSKWMQFMYRFSQGLRLRQIDMMDDSIAGSSTTLSKMANKIRKVCVTAVERMRRYTGQQIGGRREFVVIDKAIFGTNESTVEEEWLVGGKERSGSLEC